MAEREGFEPSVQRCNAFRLTYRVLMSRECGAKPAEVESRIREERVSGPRQ